MSNRIIKLICNGIALGLVLAVIFPTDASQSWNAQRVRKRASEMGASAQAGAQRAWQRFSSDARATGSDIAKAGRAVARGVRATPGAIVRGAQVSREWVMEQIAKAPTRARGRIVAGLKLYATPSDREQEVLNKWIVGKKRSKVENKILWRFVRRSLSNPKAIATIVGILAAVGVVTGGTVYGVRQYKKTKEEMQSGIGPAAVSGADESVGAPSRIPTGTPPAAAMASSGVDPIVRARVMRALAREVAQAQQAERLQREIFERLEEGTRAKAQANEEWGAALTAQDETQRAQEFVDQVMRDVPSSDAAAIVAEAKRRAVVARDREEFEAGKAAAAAAQRGPGDPGAGRLGDGSAPAAAAGERSRAPRSTERTAEAPAPTPSLIGPEEGEAEGLEFFFGEVIEKDEPDLEQIPKDPVQAQEFARQERIRAAARHQQETRKRVALQQDARYRAREQVRRQRAQEPSQGLVSSLSSLGESWVRIPGTPLEKWARIKDLIRNYITRVPTQLASGNVTESQALNEGVEEISAEIAKLQPDAKRQMLQEVVAFTSGQNPESVTAMDYRVRGFGGEMLHADLEAEFGARNLSAIPDHLRRDLKLSPGVIYSFLGLDNAIGPKTDYREMMQLLAIKMEELERNPKYRDDEGLEWLKRNLGYYFRTKQAKERYDAFIAGEDYTMPTVDEDIKDAQIRENEALMDKLLGLQGALS